MGVCFQLVYIIKALFSGDYIKLRSGKFYYRIVTSIRRQDMIFLKMNEPLTIVALFPLFFLSCLSVLRSVDDE